MKSVLFILDKFYPYNTAIVNCLNAIFEELKKENININVLTYRQNKCDKQYEFLNGINIYRVNDYYNMSNNKFLKLTFWRLYRKIFFTNDIIKIGKEIILRNKVNCVISCSYPFVTAQYALKLTRKNDILFIAYQFDPHSNNMILDKKNKNKRLKEEIETFSYVDKIFLPPENYEENMKTELKVLKDKYYPIDFALIKNNIANKPKKGKKIIFTFTGTFYENIRTPNDMLEFFKNIDMDYELHLYYIAEKTIDDVLLEYKKVFKDKLVLFNNKSKKECDEALKNSNIIVNIGNRIANQTPSKVFEYISMGKPIINFYNIENDTSKKVLKNYPLVLNIKNDYTKEDIEKFNNFVLKNKDRVLTFEEIKEKYKTAEDIAKEFIREVNKCYGIK